MENIEWMKELCGSGWMQTPFILGKHAVVTDGKGILYVQSPDVPFSGQMSPLHSKYAKTLLAFKRGERRCSFKSLRQWLGKNIPDQGLDGRLIFGCLIDCALLRKFIQYLPNARVSVKTRKEYGLSKAQLILDGKGWRLILMGMRPPGATDHYLAFPSQLKRKNKTN